MSDLNAEFGAAHAACLRNHPRQSRFIVVRVKAQAAMRDAAVPFDMGCLHNHQRCAGMRHHAKVHEVPVIGAAVIGRILAHGRNDDAVGKLKAGHTKGRKQGTGHGVGSALGEEAPVSALLDGLQVSNDGTDVTCIKAKFGHVRMAGHDALSQRLFQ